MGISLSEKPALENKISLGTLSYHGGINNDDNARINIGRYTGIGRNLTIICSKHPSVVDRRVVSNYPFIEMLTPTYSNLDYIKCTREAVINIGNDVWIGDNVTLIGNVIIGNGAIIGANSVIAKDVPAFAIAVGNPIRVKCLRFTEEQINKLEEIKWWEYDPQDIVPVLTHMKDIDDFLSRDWFTGKMRPCQG